MADRAHRWRPACSPAMLRLRACASAAIRRFFDQAGYLEVETPLLSADVVVDAHLDPFALDTQPPLFLQTSPEAAMKRLLAAGRGSIFQLGKAFRRGEAGARHNPEFTMLEWYGVGTTWREQLSLIERLVREIRDAVLPFLAAEPELAGCDPPDLSDTAFVATDYASVFRRFLNVDVLTASLPRLQQLAVERSSLETAARQIEDRDDLLNLLLAECIEPHLGDDGPEFIHDYPLSQAALAEQNPQCPQTALRFELYWNSLELCNGYQELCDPEELQRRDAAQNDSRRAHQSDALPGAPRMMAAMRSGLPDCSGVALGFDRLLMAMLGRPNIADVIPFPIDRA